MKKKVLALVLGAAMCASMLAGCGGSASADQPAASKAETESQETADAEPAATEAESEVVEEIVEEAKTPAEMIVGSYYAFTRDVGFSYDNYFHFYDSFVYVGFAVNQVTTIYSYDVVEEEKSYSCYADAAAFDAETLTEGTAPYTVNFYDRKTGELVDSCAFDGENLYNDMEVVTFQGAGPAFYVYDADPENSALAGTYEGEVGSSVFAAVNPDDETGTLDLYHTGKYLDMVNMMIEGTFTVEDGKYILTPASEGDAVVTVTDNGDGTCTYAPEGGEALTMTIKAEEKKAMYRYVGKTEVQGMEADLTITFFDDMTYVANVALTAIGNSMDIDAGTYEITATYAFVLHGDAAGELTGADYTGELEYIQAGTPAGDIDTVCTIEILE